MTEKERLRREEKAKKIDQELDTLCKEYKKLYKKYHGELDDLDEKINMLKIKHTQLVSY